MSFESFLCEVLAAEAVLVEQWGRLDPAYADGVWELKGRAVAKKKQLGGRVGWTRLRLPDSFSNAPLAAPSADAAAQAERFVRRQILRVDDHEAAGFGLVQLFTVSHGDLSAPDDATRPSLRFALGELEVGCRILRADAPCTRCFGTGGDSGSGCGFVDESGASCAGGWLGRGGAELEFAAPRSSERRVPPGDPRWRAWFEG